MKKEEIEKQAWKSALTEFPYTDEGSLEDDIDAAKRKIHMGGFILGYKLATPAIDLEEVEKLVRLVATKEASLLEFPNEKQMATDPRANACEMIAREARYKIGYTLSDLPKKEGE